VTPKPIPFGNMKNVILTDKIIRILPHPSELHTKDMPKNESQIFCQGINP
jgi:hypothetical protein